MARQDRTGNRKSRDSFQKRIPDLGYYLVVTDGEKTEQNYLAGLRQSLPKEFQSRIVIKVKQSKTDDLLETCIRDAANHPQYCEPWIVFDRDRVLNFDKIIEEAERKKVHVGWSNPCIEIWFFAHYGNMPSYVESTDCCKRFSEVFQRNTGVEYDKADNEIYFHLRQIGNEEKAITLAEKRLQQYKSDNKKPSEMCPGTTLHHLISEVRRKSDDVQQA